MTVDRDIKPPDASPNARAPRRRKALPADYALVRATLPADDQISADALLDFGAVLAVVPSPPRGFAAPLALLALPGDVAARHPDAADLLRARKPRHDSLAWRSHGVWWRDEGPKTGPSAWLVLSWSRCDWGQDAGQECPVLFHVGQVAAKGRCDGPRWSKAMDARARTALGWSVAPRRQRAAAERSAGTNRARGSEGQSTTPA
jgi:hypothetical protein